MYTGFNKCFGCYGDLINAVAEAKTWDEAPLICRNCCHEDVEGNGNEREISRIST